MREEMLKEIFEDMNTSERFGLRFALLPARLLPNSLSVEEIGRLMKMAEEEGNGLSD